MNEERCACCGDVIPEGKQVCDACVKESERGFIYVERD